MMATRSGSAIGRHTVVGAFWQMLGFTCITGCGYVVAVLLARSFGPAAYGVYGVVYSILIASELILRLGVPQSLTKLVGGSGNADSSRLQATGVTLTMLINLTGFAVVWLMAPQLADALNIPDGTRLFRIAIIDLPCFALYTCLAHVLNGKGEFKVTGIASCIYGLTRMLGVVVMTATDTLSIENALIINIAASVVGLAPLVRRAGLETYHPGLAEKSIIIALALPITLGDFGMQFLLSVDLWLLSALESSASASLIGDYVAALSLARIPNVIAFVLTAVLVPSIARALGSGDLATAGRLVIGTTRLLVLLVLPVCALVAANAEELMTLMFSEAFRPGGQLLVLLVFAQGFGYTCVGALLAILLGAGAIRVAVLRIYTVLAIAIALNLILIQAYGATGAAIATVISFAAATFLIARVVRQRVGTLLELRPALLALLAAVAVGFAGKLVPATGIMVLVECVGLGFAYLCLIWAMRLIRSGDIALLRRRPAT